MVYTAPGVYVVEDDRTPMPLTGVPTGIPCFFGFTHQGPYLKPTRINSLAEFNAIFGPRVMNKTVFPNTHLADSIYGFFLNGGSTCYVCRVNGGSMVQWPVSVIDKVVDFEDLQSDFTAATPENPKYMSLTIEAASPGAWANNLMVKCSAVSQSDGLPLDDSEAKIPSAGLPDAPTTIQLGQLKAAGTSPMPAADALNDKCVLKFQFEAAGAQQNVEANWKNADEGFGDFALLPIEPTSGTLEFKLADAADDAPPVIVPVRYFPDTGFAPLPPKPDPAAKPLPDDDLRIQDKDGTALKWKDLSGWNAATKLVFDEVAITGAEKTRLVGSWSEEDKKFYFLDGDGNPIPLHKGTIDSATVPTLDGTLTEPLKLNEGDTLTFRVDVIEPVPPRQPGQPVTHRILESYPGLSTVPGTANYFANEGLLNGVSNRIVIRKKQDADGGEQFIFGPAPDPVPDGTSVIKPSDPGAPAENEGKDEAPAPTEYIKYFPLLKQVTDVSLVACPDVYPQGATTPSFAYQPILQGLVAYCESNQCMAVIDTPPQAPVKEIGDTQKRVENLEKFVSSFRSSYAAVYSPWLVVPNTSPEDPERTKIVPPSGYLLGIYNQSDNGEGVWAAPANISVKGPVALNLPFMEDDSAQLNPAGVNLIRSFPGQGILVWGARTTTLNVMWQYVNVRRTFLYVERTLQQQTQWAVFEPNTRRTWNTLVTAAENFLRQLWLDGGLAGDTPEQAFQVRCGVPETMTQTDVDTGLLKVDIAIAPVRPAEFVVFTISQLVQVPS